MARLVTLLVLCAMAVAQHLPLPPLPYSYDALEPHLDEKTLRVHHLGHQQTYTDKLNVALVTLRSNDTTRHLAKLGIDKLLRRLEEVPEGLRAAIRNNGGGYVNHDFFWHSMSPAGGGQPSGPLLEAIEFTWGNFRDFQLRFVESATSLFGSGYTWLVADVNKALFIVNTANQDLPAAQYTPLLVIDVWEHAYYLKHQNRRVDFVNGWWDVVDWAKVQERFAAV